MVKENGNENKLDPSVASTSQKKFLRCKSFATAMATSSNNVPSRRIQNKDKADEEKLTQDNAKKQVRSERKRKGRDDDDVDFKPEEKKKYTPRKKRLPPLKLNYHKISEFFSKATEGNQTKKTPIKRRQSARVPAVSEVIVLSSSEEEFQTSVHPANSFQKQKRTKRQSDCPDKTAIDEVKKSSESLENTVAVQRRTSTNFQPMHSEGNAIEKNQDTKSATNFLQRPKRTKRPPTCPEYKVIEGTNFAVDAFRFGEIPGITKYFLTHFHSDHYVGLTKNFNMPLYLSRITGRLVNAIINVNPKYIKPMDINTTYVIDGVEVTAIDANHCPGAIMLIFKLKSGRTILHTGDFRACPEMESNPVFWNNDFYSIYLDTTYLHKSYDFDSQSDALGCVEDEVKKFKEKNIGVKFLIVVGSYLIGKERVWCHIAQSFQMKVWLEPGRRKAMDLIYSMENEDHRITDRLTNIQEEAQLHVLPMQCINYTYLMDYLKKFEDHNLLAFKPSGWEKNSKPQYGSRISIVGVQYSEHSSYRELERFVRFLRPEKVISTVPKSSSSNDTQKIPNKWLVDAIKPMKSGQSTITSFLKKQKNVPSISKPKLSITLSKIYGSLNGEDPQSSEDTDFMF